MVQSRHSIDGQAVHDAVRGAASEMPSIVRRHGDSPIGPRGLYFREWNLVIRVQPAGTSQQFKYVFVTTVLKGLERLLIQYGFHEVWCRVHIREIHLHSPDGLISLSSRFPETEQNDIPAIG